MLEKDTKYCCDCLVDMARAELVVVEKHGRPVVGVVAVKEYNWLAGRTVPPSDAKEQKDKQ